MNIRQVDDVMLREVQEQIETNTFPPQLNPFRLFNIPWNSPFFMALLFSTFDVTRQAFFRSRLSFAIVNLKPIVPGREFNSFPDFSS